MNLRKKHRLLLLFYILAAMLVIMPAGEASAAAKINVLSFSQKMRSVTLKWKSVSGASAYIITKKAADGKTGTVDQKSTVKYRQGGCEFNDIKFSSADNGKTFCYHIAAIDSRGKVIATATRILVKIPSCAITSLESSTDGKVTLTWKHYSTIPSYRLQWAEQTTTRALSFKTKNISKNKTSVTITGLKPKTKYVFYIRGAATGLYEKNKISSLGCISAKSIVMPSASRVVLHNNDGSVYKEIQADEGTQYTLPSMVNPKGYTFIGWGSKKGLFVSNSNPYETPYKAYDKIKVAKGTKHLYAVLFDRSTEKDLSESEMFSANTSKYKRVILIGDSRTKCIEYLFQTMHIDPAAHNIAFVAKSGSGLDWLKEDGYSLLLKKINEINKGKPGDKRPIALIFNSGVNNIGGNITAVSQNYINYYKSIAPELKKKGCKLFFMSVNPLVSSQYETMYGPYKKESSVREFNAKVSNGLKGVYTYLDINTWLLRTGFSTDAGVKVDSGVDDGLHYTLKTYKRILRRALKLLEVMN